MINLAKRILNRLISLIELNRLTVSWLGNTLGFSLNKRWNKFHKYCQNNYPRPNTPLGNIALQINKMGLAVMGVVPCTQLSSAVYAEFKKLGGGNLPSKTLPRESCGQFAQSFYELLTSVSPIIENYYQSYFQPYWISIQENYPGKVEASSSFGWHLDDNPRQLMKIFLYLNDVTVNNGAFRAFPTPHSKKLLRKGFVSYSEESRVKNQNIVNSYLTQHPEGLMVLEGVAGTLLMFDNNLIHKGTAPIIGYRQLAQIEVYPSAYPFTKDQIFKALTNTIEYDYPRDPKHNDIAGS